MKFRPLPESLLTELLRGEVDELTDLAQSRLQSIQAMACPRCGSALQARLFAEAPFNSRDPLPRLVGTCECGYEIDQQSRLVLHTGKPKMQEDPLPIIRPKD